MAEPKTKPTNNSVMEFLCNVQPESRRQDGLALLEMYEEITGEKAVLWGDSIVGFGVYHFKSERSKQQGDWPLAAFSPRKQCLTLYAMWGNEGSPLFDKLGKHKTSVACIYISKLADVDTKVLANLVENSYRWSKETLTESAS